MNYCLEILAEFENDKPFSETVSFFQNRRGLVMFNYAGENERLRYSVGLSPTMSLNALLNGPSEA